MQACSGCKGIVNKESRDPYYCSFCVAEGRHSVPCSCCGEPQRYPFNGVCGKCSLNNLAARKIAESLGKTYEEIRKHVTIETTVYFECGYCGQPLEADTHHDHGRVTISPCKHCLEQARGELLKKLLSYENKGPHRINHKLNFVQNNTNLPERPQNATESTTDPLSLM